MAVRSVKLLHVEDDDLQRLILKAHLDAQADLAFDIAYAGSEDEAIDRFNRGTDLILLDYHLATGNGLNCLKRIRQRDAVVPIIAISGTATPEIAAELLEAGADDYFSKEGLDADELGQSMRAALARADAWKSLASDDSGERRSLVCNELESICRDFVRSVGPDFLTRLSQLETTARAVKLTFAQTLKVFETVCERIGATADAADPKRLLRPIMLELVLRLFEETPSNG